MGQPRESLASQTRAQVLDLFPAGHLGSSSSPGSIVQTAAVGSAPATVRLRAGLDSPAAGLHSQRQKLRSSTSACLRGSKLFPALLTLCRRQVSGTHLSYSNRAAERCGRLTLSQSRTINFAWTFCT